MPKVLIVDDEAVNLELAEALIQAEGYQAILASDGEIALQKIQEKPDIIMMDIVMPRMNGIETCRKIKTNPLSYAIPVIIVTALNTQEEKLKAIKAGADDFIAKPFDRAELSARLKSLIRLKAIHDRLEVSLSSLKEMQRVREELLARAAKDVEPPLRVIAECLQAITAEQHQLTPETSAKIEPAMFCLDMASTMANDLVNIMRMEQDKLRQAYESLMAQEQSAETPPPPQQ
jgi:DNA-binding response OmpR family regulator